MIKMIIPILIAFLSACTPLTLIDGTMLDDHTDKPIPEATIDEIKVEGDNWELHYSVDGYRIDNVKIIGVRSDGLDMNITDRVTFVSSDNEHVTISYGGCTAELPIKSGESIKIHIDPETIYYNFYMPDKFPASDDVFVGWGTDTEEPLPFPIVRYSRSQAPQPSQVLPVLSMSSMAFLLQLPR